MTNNQINVSVTPSKSFKVDVTAPNQQGNITVSPDTSAYNAEIARQWAVSDSKVLQEDYSAKYYANKSQTSANTAKNFADASQSTFQQVQDSANNVLDNIETNKNSAIEEIETIKTNAVNTANEANTTINTNKTNAINEINTTKNSAVSRVNTTKTSAITEINNTKTTAVNAVNTSKNQALNDIEKESSSIINFKEEVNAELENKVDLDDMVAFNMQEVPCITETYINGSSWYRVYSDGWCEQGGVTEAGTVTFLKAFSNTNYLVLVNNREENYNANSQSDNLCQPNSLTTTSFHTNGRLTMQWYACGYIA